MVAEVGFDVAWLTNAMTSGIGREVAALLVAAIAYLVAAAAISLMPSGGGGQNRDDIAGLVLITTLIVYLIFSPRLDPMWFGIASVALLALAAAGMLLAEAKAFADRVRLRTRSH